MQPSKSLLYIAILLLLIFFFIIILSLYWTNSNTSRSGLNVTFHIFNMFYKIIQIVCALWLAIKPFYMSVCKHAFHSSFISYFIKEISNGFCVYIAWCKHGNHFTFLQSSREMWRIYKSIICCHINLWHPPNWNVLVLCFSVHVVSTTVFPMMRSSLRTQD